MALWEEKKTCRATNAESSSQRMCPRCSAASRRCSIREIIRSRHSRSRYACKQEQNVNSSKKILSSRIFFANCQYTITHETTKYQRKGVCNRILAHTVVLD